jgi:hypothetical protein
MHVCRGNLVPSMTIFARQRIKAQLADGAPLGTNFTRNMGGKVKLDFFSKVLTFLIHTKPIQMNYCCYP